MKASAVCNRCEGPARYAVQRCRMYAYVTWCSPDTVYFVDVMIQSADVSKQKSVCWLAYSGYVIARTQAGRHVGTYAHRQ